MKKIQIRELENIINNFLMDKPNSGVEMTRK